MAGKRQDLSKGGGRVAVVTEQSFVHLDVVLERSTWRRVFTRLAFIRAICCHLARLAFVISKWLVLIHDVFQI